MHNLFNFFSGKFVLPVFLLIPFFFAAASFAQQPPGSAPAAQPGLVPATVPVDTAKAAAYRLGAGDQILIRVSNAPELNEKQYRIDPDGFINVPTIGRVQAGGMTVAALETELNKRLGVFQRSLKSRLGKVEIDLLQAMPTGTLPADHFPMEGDSRKASFRKTRRGRIDFLISLGRHLCEFEPFHNPRLF